MAILSLPLNVSIKAVDSTMSLISLHSRMSHWQSRKYIEEGLQHSHWVTKRASVPMLNSGLMSQFFPSVFRILLRSLSPNNLFSGSWSVTMILGQPMTNIQHFSNCCCITFYQCIPALSISTKSVANKYLFCANLEWGKSPGPCQMLWSQKGSMTGPNEYTRVTWLALVIVLGTGKFSIIFCMDSNSVTPEGIILRLEIYPCWVQFNFFYTM